VGKLEHVETPVLIVGGGPVGFALALDLAWRGQRSMLVEREAGTALGLLAKATGLHERTIEMCRRWGIAGRVQAAGFPQDFPGDSVYATSLDGYVLGRSAIPSTSEREAPAETPVKRLRCPQYEFDPLLARAVAERGLTDVRYGAAVESLEQDADGVTVTIAEADTGRRYTCRAEYVVACDGAGSTLRRTVGVPFEGEMLDFSLSAMIRIPALDLPKELQGGERYILIGPEGAWAVLVSVDGREIWRLTVVGSQERLNPATFDMDVQIRRALGEGVPYERRSVAPWRRSQCAAATFRVGRVLLAGDSAHTMSPTGGHGLNTGIGDVSDLGWMLTALVEGWGGEGLLHAYDLERRPVAIRNATSATANYHGQVSRNECKHVLDPGSVGQDAREHIGKRLVDSLASEWYTLGIDLGFRYEGSPIIVPDGTPPPPDDPTNYLPTARPGHRAPHAWLADGRSTLDLFGRGFVLLRFGAATEQTGPADDQLQREAERIGMPLSVVDIAEPEIAQAYEQRLVLVRPDGHVAWRDSQAPEDVPGLLDTIRGVSR